MGSNQVNTQYETKRDAQYVHLDNRNNKIIKIIKASMPTKFVSQYLDPLYILSVLMAINELLRQRVTVGKQVVGGGGRGGVFRSKITAS